MQKTKKYAYIKQSNQFFIQISFSVIRWGMFSALL